MFNFLSKNEPSFFGVDLGNTGVKAVQLAKENKGIVLKNYVYLDNERKLNEDGSFERKNAGAISDQVIEDMKLVVNSAKIGNKKVVMSIPTSSAFSYIVTLPKMPQGALGKAVDFEARKYIPLPLEEVVFAWSVVSSEKVQNKPGAHAAESLRVLLIAIPKEISARYMEIARSFNLDLIALETESFALARSLVGKREGVYLIVDMGSRITSVTVVEDGLVGETRNIASVGGEEITKVIASGFNVNEQRAETMKKEIGLDNTREQKLSEIIDPIFSMVVAEIRKNADTYLHGGERQIAGVIFTGGISAMPGFQNYFSRALNMPVEMGNPFRDIVYDPVLEEKIKTLCPFFAVGVGLALRGFDQK